LYHINRAFYQCNDIRDNSDGLNLSQNNTRINIKGNTFESNERGLVYQANATAPQQLNHGNLFYNNTLGAIYEGTPNGTQINNALYTYDISITAEHPVIVIPSTWFISDTTTSFKCILPLPEEEEQAENEADLLQVLQLIGCAGNEAFDGDCYDNL